MARRKQLVFKFLKHRQKNDVCDVFTKVDHFFIWYEVFSNLLRFVKNLQNSWAGDSLSVSIWKVRRPKIQLRRSNINYIWAHRRTFRQGTSISIQNLQNFLFLFFVWFQLLNFNFLLHLFLHTKLNLELKFLVWLNILFLNRVWFLNLNCAFNWPLRVDKRTRALKLSSFTLHK